MTFDFVIISQEEASYVESKCFMVKGHSHLGRFMNILKLRSQFKLKIKDQPTVSKSTLTIYGDDMIIILSNYN